jgi:hypothetical protein
VPARPKSNTVITALQFCAIIILFREDAADKSMRLFASSLAGKVNSCGADKIRAIDAVAGFALQMVDPMGNALSSLLPQSSRAPVQRNTPLSIRQQRTSAFSTDVDAVIRIQSGGKSELVRGGHPDLKRDSVGFAIRGR